MIITLIPRFTPRTATWLRRTRPSCSLLGWPDLRATQCQGWNKCSSNFADGVDIIWLDQLLSCHIFWSCKKPRMEINLFCLSRPEEVEATATLRACVIANQVKPKHLHQSPMWKPFPGEVSPVCGARDEQVRREGDYGEEEGGRSKFLSKKIALLICWLTNWWQIIHVCSGDNGGTNSCLFGNWWFASFYLFSAKRQPEIFIHWNDYRIISLGPKLKLFRDPLLQPMLAPCCRSCSVSTSQVLISNACWRLEWWMWFREDQDTPRYLMELLANGSLQVFND